MTRQKNLEVAACGRGANKSRQAFAAARQVMPGGVNSPVRAYRAVGCDPVFIREGAGCRVTDLDGRSYIDYVLAYGPLILGHACDPVMAALTKAVSHGTAFGMPTEAETTLARLLIDALPGLESIRLVNSGTEAVMSAIRLARAATGRDKIIKCIGCYHGHSDGLLVQAGSGATTLGVPSSPGIPAAFTQQTLLVPYNDLEAVRQTLRAHSGQVAAMVVEPVAGNMGCVPPEEGYLAGLRQECTAAGALLIFDEVMTGFRVAYGGAQTLYGIRPDITCLGKVIGGGLPCAAYGACRKLMSLIAPDGPVYQAGTLSGNPLAVAAGIATLEILRTGELYTRLERASAALADGLAAAARKAKVNMVVNRVGSMLTCFFTAAQAVRNYADATACDTQAFARFFRGMLQGGVLLPPSQFEAWFVSSAHDQAAIEHTLAAAERALAAVRAH